MTFLNTIPIYLNILYTILNSTYTFFCYKRGLTITIISVAVLRILVLRLTYLY